MGKSYYEKEKEKAELAYALLSEMFGQKSVKGEVTADNVGIYSEVLADAKARIEYQKRNIERDKAEEADSAVKLLKN